MGRVQRLGLLVVVLAVLMGGLAVSPARVGASGTWGTTGGMLTARSYHTATLLPNGKVLVVGGYGSVGYYGNGSLNSTELFDPATGTWTATAPMTTPRYGHAATLLPDGRVLVLGGASITYPGGTAQKDILSSAEIYDPAMNSWTMIGGLKTPRVGPKAIPLRTGPNAGKVLIIAGCTTGYPNRLSSVELFDPNTGTSTDGASTAYTYCGTIALPLADGRVFIMEPYYATYTAEIYDPLINSWTTTPPMASRSQYTAATLLANGKVLVSSGDIYNPVSNSWSRTAQNDFAGYVGTNSMVTLPSGVVITIGSGGGSARYDAQKDQWTSAPTLNSDIGFRSATTTLLADGRILVAGGGLGDYGEGKPLSAVRLYNDTPFTMALTSTAGGTATVIPIGPYTGGTTVTLTATPSAGYLFTGWAVDGKTASYANPLTLTINDASRTAVATFGTLSSFSDVPTGSPAATAIAQLAARGIIKGYQDGRFGPNDRTLRAQMAALVCRAMGWDSELWLNPFTDRKGVDDNLWRNIGTLNHYGVARGYNYNTYGTTDNVLNVQVIAFISRAMVAKGYWQQQYANSSLYPNVPLSSGHQGDLATYVHYAGALPDNPNTNGSFANWDQPSTRAWFARALWQALSSYFATNQVP